MNVFGIGTLELLVILLVAFIALGPGKTVEVARTIGRMAREARRTFTDIMDAASVTEDETGPRPRRADAPAQPPSEPLPLPTHLQGPETAPEADDGAPAEGNAGPAAPRR